MISPTMPCSVEFFVVLAGDAAAQIPRAPGGDGHEPPIGRVPRQALPICYCKLVATRVTEN
jgi:hypothetical protein